MAVTVRDNGYNAMRARVVEMAKQTVVDVGVQGNEASAEHAGGKTNADVATWMEFGTSKLPQRSWLRDYVDENEAKIKRNIILVIQKVVKGDLASVDQAMELVGIKIQEDILARIKSGIAPPLAASTEARKGHSTPLIHTRQFIDSITYAVKHGVN